MQRDIPKTKNSVKRIAMFITAVESWLADRLIEALTRVPIDPLLWQRLSDGEREIAIEYFTGETRDNNSQRGCWSSIDFVRPAPGPLLVELSM